MVRLTADALLPAAPVDAFLLGGADLEMLEIAKLVERARPGAIAAGPDAWGVRASAFAEPLRHALAVGARPVMVEVIDDLGAEWDALGRDRIVWIDHHGERASEPASLRQVFDLLGLAESEWTPWLALVAANDAGYLPAMRALGADAETMRRVRAADRGAQGVTEAQEAAARIAVAERRKLGGVTLVRLPHNRFAPVTDALHRDLGGPGYRTLVIAGPTEIGVYAPPAVIEALREAAIEPAWWGGNAADERYWGTSAIERLDRIIKVAKAADAGLPKGG